MPKIYYVEYRAGETYNIYIVPAQSRKQARFKAKTRLNQLHTTPVTLVLITDDATKLNGKPMENTLG